MVCIDPLYRPYNQVQTQAQEPCNHTRYATDITHDAMVSNGIPSQTGSRRTTRYHGRAASNTPA